MAIDQSAKCVEMAVEVVALSGTLMDTVRRLAALTEESQRSGLDFVPEGVPLDFADASQVVGRKVALVQCDGQGIVDAMASATTVKTFLDVPSIRTISTKFARSPERTGDCLERERIRDPAVRGRPPGGHPPPHARQRAGSPEVAAREAGPRLPAIPDGEAGP